MASMLCPWCGEPSDVLDWLVLDNTVACPSCADELKMREEVKTEVPAAPTH